jgi:hypothetical protein
MFQYKCRPPGGNVHIWTLFLKKSLERRGCDRELSHAMPRFGLAAGPPRPGGLLKYQTLLAGHALRIETIRGPSKDSVEMHLVGTQRP